MNKIKTGIIGATGYTGSELVRILLRHPEVSLEFTTSESYAGQKFSDVHAQFRGIYEDRLIKSEDAPGKPVDILFLALPHRISMNYVRDHFKEGSKIIDLSGDFRLSSPVLYEKWYETKHVFPEGFEKAVYGMPELNKEKIKSASLVANPGCYPTSSILPLAPLVKNDLVEMKSIIVDAKSGVTGAGNKPKTNTHFPTANENFSVYGILNHRHTPEIQGTLSDFSGKKVEVLFTPHLLPVNRGILTTTYSTPAKPVSADKLRDTFREFYSEAPFVRVMDSLPQIQNVRGSNFCDIYVTFDQRTNRVLTVSAIDNLVKGAAGQAVHNLNLMMGLEEKTGLEAVPLSP